MKNITRHEVLDEINDHLDSLTSFEVQRIFRRVSLPDLILLEIAIRRFGKEQQLVSHDE